MTNDNWYRNVDWDKDIEAIFRAKLARSRSGRPQYLEIQAGMLADRHPLVSLQLVEEYFQTGDAFFTSAAYGTKARAYRSLGKLDDAIAAYKLALDWEAQYPGFRTNAYLELPKLVAEERLADEYDYAIQVLTSRFSESDHRLPSIRYTWNGSCALITYAQGKPLEAKEFAERALRAAEVVDSPFPRHRGVGLVKDTSDNFMKRIKELADGPNAHPTFWGVLSKNKA